MEAQQSGSCEQKLLFLLPNYLTFFCAWNLKTRDIDRGLAIICHLTYAILKSAFDMGTFRKSAWRKYGLIMPLHHYVLFYHWFAMTCIRYIHLTSGRFRILGCFHEWFVTQIHHKKMEQRVHVLNLFLCYFGTNRWLSSLADRKNIRIALVR